MFDVWFKDPLSNSRERGPLPVGPHPRLFLTNHAGVTVYSVYNTVYITSS